MITEKPYSFAVRNAAIALSALGSVSLVSAGELEITPFAEAPVLKNVTAVHVDNNGRVFAVETTRRKGGEWTLGDRERSYGVGSIEEKRAYLEELRKSGASISSVQDNNKDGKKNVADLETNKEKIHLLEDRDGDGKAEFHKVFAEGFNDALDGIGAGVFAYEGDVFFTCFPNLWRLRDEDGDGVAEKKEIMHTGFAIQLGQKGHDLHGPTIGPYGRLYWSLGDRGFSVVRKEDGKRFHYPYHGAVVRCELDGGGFEVFASGLRNNVEFAFDQFGDMISADNDGDFGGELERLVYILEGSDHGWRRNWQFQKRYNPWMKEKMFLPYFKDQSAHITPPIANFRSGPCGFAYEPGTALNEKYRGCFFMNYAPAGKMFALRLEPDGAAFKMTAQEPIPSAGTPTGLNFGPDGALYIADWSGGYDRNNKGGVFKLDDPEAAGSPIRKEVQKLLGEGMSGRPEAELAGLLGHADMRVRLDAQFEMVRRGEIEKLIAVASSQERPQMARIHGIWGMAQMHRTKLRKDTVAAIENLLTDADAEIRTQAAMAAREIADKSLAPELVKALGDGSLRMRLKAAMALGKCGSGADVPALFGMLAVNDDADAFIRFGGVLGLSEIADVKPIIEAKTHASAAVRVGAVLALRRLSSPTVAQFLEDRDPRVVREAVRAIHDDHSIPSALPQVAALADFTLPDDEALVRRVLNANVRVPTAESATRLVRFAQNASNPRAMRIEALDCLRTWCKPDVFDRVEGNLRRNEPGKRDDIEAISPLLAGLAADPNKDIQSAFAAVVKAHGLNFDKKQFLAWLGDVGLPMETRLQAFDLLMQAKGDVSKQALVFALGSDLELQLAGILALQKENPFAALEKLEELDRAETSVKGQRAIIETLGKWPDEKAVALILEKMAALETDSVSRELRLDVVEAARNREEGEVQNAVKSYESGFEKGDLLAPYRDVVFGGDPHVGGEIFRDHPVAQCVRCHRVGGDGSDFGPDLRGVATRLDSEKLLESLINPSARIAEGFALVTVETKGGETVGGTLRSETDEKVEIVIADGTLKAIRKEDIKQRSVAEVSTMPPMGTILNKMELRAVVSYLKSLK